MRRAGTTTAKQGGWTLQKASTSVDMEMKYSGFFQRFSRPFFELPSTRARNTRSNGTGHESSRIGRLSALVALLTLCLTGTANATFIQGDQALSSPDVVLGFDEHGRDGVAIQDQYALSHGVTFSKPLFTVYSDILPGVDEYALSGVGAFEIRFSQTVTNLAVSFLTLPGLSRFHAYLDGTLVERFTAVTNMVSSQHTFFGLQNIEFDTLHVIPGGAGNGFWLDTLQFSPVRALAVSTPGTPILLGTGFLMLLALRRRRQ